MNQRRDAAQKGGGAIAGFGKTRRSSMFSQFRAPWSKRKVWGGREEDDELTNAKKKGAGSPTSSNDRRQESLGFSTP
jgi:hypothetical protein